MYYVKFYKRDRDYIYLYNEKNFINKFLTWFSLYNYIRDNNIQFNNVRFIKLDIDLLFYHLMNFTDMENEYLSHKKYNYTSRISSTKYNERIRF